MVVVFTRSKSHRPELSITRGSLEVKLPTIWTDEKQRWEESDKRREEKRREEKRRRRKIKKRKSQKKEDPGARKGRKVAKHCIFPMICGSGGSKSRLAKAGAEPCGQMRDETIACRCGAKHISKSKCTKHLMFGALLEVEMSKRCTPLWREAQVKSVKTDGFRALVEVEMSKKCTPLWREAHFEVKMRKTPHVWTAFGS